MIYTILIATDEVASGQSLAQVLSRSTAASFKIELVHDLHMMLVMLCEQKFSALILARSLSSLVSGPEFAAALRQQSLALPILLIDSDNKIDASAEIAAHVRVRLPKSACGNELSAHVLSDLIQRSALECERDGQRKWAQVVLDAIADGVLTTDRDGKIRYLNTAAEKLTGWKHNEALHSPAAEVLKLVWGPTGDLLCPHPVMSVLASSQVVRVPPKTLLIRADGTNVAIVDFSSPLFAQDGQLDGVVVVFHDITAEYQAGEKLAYLAQHDSLKSVPNRLLLVDRITQAVAFAERNRTKFALLFVDLDRFKHINDTLGHAVGDKLLCSVAQRLQKCVRNSDTVSRIGGDEFAVLLSQDISEDAAEQIFRKIEAEIAAPHCLNAHTLRIRCSIGISFYPAAGKDVEQLLHAADQAMYKIKRHSPKDVPQEKRQDTQTAALLVHALRLQSEFGHEPAQRYMEDHGFSRVRAYELLTLRFDRRSY